jgi:6-phosphogluconolactonase
VTLDVLPDPAALAAHAARWLAKLANAKAGPFTVALSGGSTPRLMYEKLAGEDFPWERTHWFWGDERFVPPDDPQSNYRMAREAMLWRAPAANIHPIPTIGVAPEEAAAQYERELRAFQTQDPLFDVTLLGLGADGHTASLFPGSPALDERTRWTAVAQALGHIRITLTYPALDSSAHVAFLVTGAEKRDVLRRVQAGDAGLPASRIRPRGELRFLVDSEAAA